MNIEAMTRLELETTHRRLRDLVDRSGLVEVPATTVDYSARQPKVVAAGNILVPADQREQVQRETALLAQVAKLKRQLAEANGLLREYVDNDKDCYENPPPGSRLGRASAHLKACEAP